MKNEYWTQLRLNILIISAEGFPAMVSVDFERAIWSAITAVIPNAKVIILNTLLNNNLQIAKWIKQVKQKQI